MTQIHRNSLDVEIGYQAFLFFSSLMTPMPANQAIGAAAREQLHVLRGAMRTFNLLEKPGDFMKDWKIRLTVLRYLLRGRKKNAQRRLQPGLGRDELLAMLDRLDGEKRDAA